MKLLIFLIGFPIAMVLIIYRGKVVEFTGKLQWAEYHLGQGGTYTLVIILAMVIWIACMMYALGSFDQVVGFLAPLFGKS